MTANIKFNTKEIELMYNILVRVKIKYEKSTEYREWIDVESLNSLITRFKGIDLDMKIMEALS